MSKSFIPLPVTRYLSPVTIFSSLRKVPQMTGRKAARTAAHFLEKLSEIGAGAIGMRLAILTVDDAGRNNPF